MKSFLGMRFSPNKTRTPDGFLVAHNVPISRAGWYEYLGSELPESFGIPADKFVKVFRPPAEVFTPSSIASYEGKPLTDGHPPDGMSPENASQYVRGSVQNVRQGTGENSDLLLADLNIYDKQLMDDIENGKREVSAGYEYDILPNGDGTYSQSKIVGNHVAVVEKGRAGNRVRINDASPNDEAEKASKKYGISVLSSGHRTPPEGYPPSREQYADPVNYKYPIDRDHIDDDPEFYNRDGEREKGGYTPREWETIGRRIVDASNRLRGSGFELKDGKIITSNERGEMKGADAMTKKFKLPVPKRSRVKDALAALGLKHYAADADPDDIMEAMDAYADERREEDGDDPNDASKPAATPKDPATDADPATEDVPAWAKQLMEQVKALADSKAKDADPEDAIDAEIAKLEAAKGDNPDSTEEEESQTIPADLVGDDGEPITPPEDRPMNALKTVDSGYRLAALKAMKPVIAAIKDPVERKKASDAAAKSIMGIPSRNAYAEIQAANRKRASDENKKIVQKQEQDISQLGRDIAAKRNPHYKAQQ